MDTSKVWGGALHSLPELPCKTARYSQQSLLVQYLYQTGVLQLVPWVLASKKSLTTVNSSVRSPLRHTALFFKLVSAAN